MLGRYIHKLTGEKRDTMVNECVGGLLADEMGLGKSLSLLALIVHTMEEAQRFRNDLYTSCPRQLPRIGATLIVTPYSSESFRTLRRSVLTVYKLCGTGKMKSQSMFKFGFWRTLDSNLVF
jgi:SNF2-related domain